MHSAVTHLVLKELLLEIPGGPMVRDLPTYGIQEDPTYREQLSLYNVHLESGSKSRNHKEKPVHRN